MVHPESKLFFDHGNEGLAYESRLQRLYPDFAETKTPNEEEATIRTSTDVYVFPKWSSEKGLSYTARVPSIDGLRRDAESQTFEVTQDDLGTLPPNSESFYKQLVEVVEVKLQKSPVTIVSF